jgi:adenylate kinase family enzyme
MTFLDYIETGEFKKINVVGCPGAGKSTVAKLISTKTGYPLFDLDNYLYNSGCKRKSHSETLSEIDKIATNECFVIDGTYTSSFEHRLTRLDLVVFIDKSSVICIYQFFKRLIIGQNLKCGERLTMKTFKLLFSFNLKYRKELKRLAEKHQVHFYILNQRKW